MKQKLCYIYIMHNCKGQNVVEYVLLVTAVVMVCLYFFTNGPMKQSINASLNSMVNSLNGINNEIIFTNN